MVKGIIFDMDGTITLTEQFHHEAFDSIFKEYGIDFPFEEEAKKYAGSGSKNIFTSVFKERNIKVTEEEIEKCMAKKKTLYKKIVQERPIPVVEGAKTFIEKVHSLGLKKIIATGNSDLDAVRFILEKSQLLQYFPEIISISEVGKGKPFPDVFLEAAKRLNLQKEQCVIFEDAINGVTAAKAAGIRCIALSTTTDASELINAGADAVIKNYDEITDKLLQLK